MGNRIVDISEVQFSKKGRARFTDPALLADLQTLQAGQALVWENGQIDMTQAHEAIVTDRARVRANVASVIEQAGMKEITKISFTVSGDCVVTIKPQKKAKK
jgi:hypothetical protein